MRLGSWSALLAAAVVAFAAFGVTASKAAVQVHITFDTGKGVATGGGPNSTWTENGFFFTPANRQSSAQCADAQCVQELSQGQITTMTNLAGLPFNLDEFYFNMQGTGSPSAINSLTVTGNFIGGGSISETFTLGQFSSILNEVVQQQTGYIVMLNAFNNLSSAVFSASSTAMVRIDDIKATVIPLPAPALLLLGALAGLGLFGARKSRSAA